MVDFGAFKGDYTGTVVRDNTIYGGFATDDEDEDVDEAESKVIVVHP